MRNHLVSSGSAVSALFVYMWFQHKFIKFLRIWSDGGVRNWLSREKEKEEVKKNLPFVRVFIHLIPRCPATSVSVSFANSKTYYELAFVLLSLFSCRQKTYENRSLQEELCSRQLKLDFLIHVSSIAILNSAKESDPTFFRRLRTRRKSFSAKGYTLC